MARRDVVTVILGGYPVALVSRLDPAFLRLLVGTREGTRGLTSFLRGPGVGPGGYVFHYGYPLKVPQTREHEVVGRHGILAVGDFLRPAALDYVEIYASVKRWEPAGGRSVRPALGEANPYGIWGHALSDLTFEFMEINPRTGDVTFGIGS